MTTTTSTTGTSTTGTTASGTAVQTATKSLLTSLGTGSGVDTSTLVGSLVEAQFAARTAQLTQKSEKLTAQISGVSTIRSAVSGFATALDGLAKGGALTTQPRLSNASVLGATALPGARLSSLSATVRVDRLAAAQTVATGEILIDDKPVSRDTVLGSGKFTLQLGTATYGANGASITGFEDSKTENSAVTFSLDGATLDTLAAAINAQGAKLGVTASVVTGADGAAFLSMKGATGAANAFTLSTDTTDAALAKVAVGKDAATSVTATAQNAALVVDGVPVERAGNSIDDLVAGVKLDLSATGTTTLSATRPTDALAQAVADVVETYNQVVAVIAAQTDPINGTLFSDSAAQSLLRQLRGLTLANLNPGAAAGAPSTLAELGVTTARDGTLSVDTKQLNKVLAAQPDAVEAMFASSTVSTKGLPAILNALSATATSSTAGLGASTSRYTGAQNDIADAREKITTESAAMNTRLSAQFAAMNARVTAYKSVQSFLTNQIAAWNKSDS